MPTKSAPLEASLTFINNYFSHNADYFVYFCSVTNLNFNFMVDLEKTINYSLKFLTAFENMLVVDMTSVESEVDIEGSPDSVLLQNYNTCGYILAAIRDIKKELEQDGQ